MVVVVVVVVGGVRSNLAAFYFACFYSVIGIFDARDLSDRRRRRCLSFPGLNDLMEHREQCKSQAEIAQAENDSYLALCVV